MATTKRVAKKAAKKAVPKVKEEVKQIVLTQEQWDDLSSIRFALTAIGYELEGIFNDEDKNARQIAFEVAKACKELTDQQSKLDKITDDTDPNPVDYWDEFEGDDNDN